MLCLGMPHPIGYQGQLLGMSALTWLFITRIGAGIAGATISTAQAYIADVTGPKERAKGMALIGAAFGIGFTFGPLIGAAFVSADPVVNLSNEQFEVLQSLRTAEMEYTTDDIIAGVAEIAPLTASDESILRTALDDPEIEVIPTPSAAPGYVAAILSALAFLFAIFKLPESLTPESKAAERQWLNVGLMTSLLGTRTIGVVLVGIFVSTFAFAQFESSLSLLTQRMGMAPRYNFYVFAYIGFVLTLSQGFFVRRMVPKLGEYKMALLGAILMTVGTCVDCTAGSEVIRRGVVCDSSLECCGLFLRNTITAIAVVPLSEPGSTG